MKRRVVPSSILSQSREINLTFHSWPYSFLAFLQHPKGRLIVRVNIASPCVSTAGSYSQHTVHMATNYRLALSISVCPNQSQGWVPCYWPFCRSERHQLWITVTLPSVTLPLWCGQHFTDHGAGPWSWDHCCWEMTGAKLNAKQPYPPTFMNNERSNLEHLILKMTMLL